MQIAKKKIRPSPAPPIDPSTVELFSCSRPLDTRKIFLARKTDPTKILFWGYIDNLMKDHFRHQKPNISENFEINNWYRNWYNEICIDIWLGHSFVEIKHSISDFSWLHYILEWLDEHFIIVQVVPVQK